MTSTNSERPALTLREARDALSLKSQQRVWQLLDEGVLTGPEYEGKRAPRNAKRVWVDSIEALQRDRAAEASAKPASAPQRIAALEQQVAELRETVTRLTRTDSVAELARVQAAERKARAAGLELKVAAEAALAALDDEQTRNRELGAENHRLRTLLQQAERREAARSQVARSFSDGLTQFLASDTIED